MFLLMAEAVFDLLIPDSKQVVGPAQWMTDASQLHVPEWTEVRDIWRKLDRQTKISFYACMTLRVPCLQYNSSYTSECILHISIGW